MPCPKCRRRGRSWGRRVGARHAAIPLPATLILLISANVWDPRELLLYGTLNMGLTDERAPSMSTPPIRPSDPPTPPPRPSDGSRRGAHFGLFVASGIFLGVAVAVVAVVLVAAARAETDSERQAVAFFLTAALPFCGISVLLLWVGLFVKALGRPRRR
jgi:hypothetical protein